MNRLTRERRPLVRIDYGDNANGVYRSAGWTYSPAILMEIPAAAFTCRSEEKASPNGEAVEAASAASVGDLII